MVKVWFPTMYMTLVQSKRAAPPALSKATFNVPKSMTKTEVKEYLSKIYEMDVQKVNTVNMIGSWKTIAMQASIVNNSKIKVMRAQLLPRIKAYKRPNVKRAYVDFLDHGYPKD